MKPRIATFTVVQNCFAALEATQHTDYDVIIVQKDLPSLDIHGMLKVVRAVGNDVPFILMHPIVSTYQRKGKYPPSPLLESARKMDLSNVLMQPYSSETLCTAISEAIEYNDHEVAEVNRKKQILRDEEERAHKFQAFATGNKVGVLVKPAPAKKRVARKKRARQDLVDDTQQPQRAIRQIGNVLEEAKLTEPPPGAYDPAASYVRILADMQANVAMRPAEQEEACPLSSSEEAAHFLAQMANNRK